MFYGFFTISLMQLNPLLPIRIKTCKDRGNLYQCGLKMNFLFFAQHINPGGVYSRCISVLQWVPKKLNLHYSGSANNNFFHFSMFLIEFEAKGKTTTREVIKNQWIIKYF